MDIKPIAYIYTDFKDKFGIPRQSGRVPSLEGKIVMERAFSTEEAFRGIEEFSHLWLIFDFSKAHREKHSPTVRPPWLGGNKRVGVFASRSPYRPNSMGLSPVQLKSVERTNDGVIVLNVLGADILSGTPIYDIKPYIPYVDSITDARGSFAEEFKDYSLAVDFPEDILKLIPPEKREALISCLSEDPRPSYQEYSERVYKMSFAGFDISFRVSGKKLFVTEASKE